MSIHELSNLFIKSCLLKYIAITFPGSFLYSSIISTIDLCFLPPFIPSFLLPSPSAWIGYLLTERLDGF